MEFKMVAAEGLSRKNFNGLEGVIIGYVLLLWLLYLF